MNSKVVLVLVDGMVPESLEACSFPPVPYIIRPKMVFSRIIYPSTKTIHIIITGTGINEIK